MKKIALLIIALVFVLSLCACGNDTDAIAEDLTWKIEHDTLYISGNGRMPDYVDENGERTDRPWEDKLNDFYYIEVGEGITSIGAYAFNGSQNVIEVSLPHTLKSIGDCAFMACLNLMEIDIPGDVETIGSSAFRRCYSLSEVVIHENIISVGDNAFSKCVCMSKVVIKDNIESIGKDVFTEHNYGYTVEFEGTKSRWEEIGGADAADDNITVICSDGSFGE